MRTLIKNRRRERAAYPQAERRRRARRAANVNQRRWLARAEFFLAQEPSPEMIEKADEALAKAQEWDERSPL